MGQVGPATAIVQNAQCFLGVRARCGAPDRIATACFATTARVFTRDCDIFVETVNRDFFL